MIITDAGINIATDLGRKRDIVMNAVDVMHALGYKHPGVAALSFIEKIENKDLQPSVKQATLDAEQLTQMCRLGQLPSCTVDGPFALDNAISPYAAAHLRNQRRGVGAGRRGLDHNFAHLVQSRRRRPTCKTWPCARKPTWAARPWADL